MSDFLFIIQTLRFVLHVSILTYQPLEVTSLQNTPLTIASGTAATTATPAPKPPPIREPIHANITGSAPAPTVAIPAHPAMAPAANGIEESFPAIVSKYVGAILFFLHTISIFFVLAVFFHILLLPEIYCVFLFYLVSLSPVLFDPQKLYCSLNIYPYFLQTVSLYPLCVLPSH